MDNKTLSIVSYITLIGWLIAYFAGKENADALLKYHLRQSFGIMILTFIVSIIVNILVFVSPVFIYLGIISLFFFILTIIGIINAANQVMKPLPLIGKLFENKFAFIG